MFVIVRSWETAIPDVDRCCGLPSGTADRYKCLLQIVPDIIKSNQRFI